jgi:hypothetical protein
MCKEPADDFISVQGDVDVKSDAASIGEQTTAPRKHKNNATGPRTKAGKQRASRNALKHGIFAKVVALDGESNGEYQKIWSELRADRKPQGAQEELWVEKLALDFWRLSRLYRAEVGAVQKHRLLFEWNNKSIRTEPVEDLVIPVQGLLRNSDNRYALRQSIMLLNALRSNLEKDGINEQRDQHSLLLLFGQRGEFAFHFDIYELYQGAVFGSQITDEEREAFGSPSQEAYQKELIKRIDQEIERLQQYESDKESMETARHQAELLYRSIPDSKDLETLMRYEATIQRSIDRGLTQLERLQRMRLGEPVMPPIKLDVSS